MYGCCFYSVTSSYCVPSQEPTAVSHNIGKYKLCISGAMVADVVGVGVLILIIAYLGIRGPQAFRALPLSVKCIAMASPVTLIFIGMLYGVCKFKNINHQLKREVDQKLDREERELTSNDNKITSLVEMNAGQITHLIAQCEHQLKLSNTLLARQNELLLVEGNSEEASELKKQIPLVEDDIKNTHEEIEKYRAQLTKLETLKEREAFRTKEAIARINTTKKKLGKL